MTASQAWAVSGAHICVDTDVSVDIETDGNLNTVIITIGGSSICCDINAFAVSQSSLDFLTYGLAAIFDHILASNCNDEGDDSEDKHRQPDRQKADTISANEASVLDAFEDEAECRDDKHKDGEGENDFEQQFSAFLEIVHIVVFLELIEDVHTIHHEGENDHADGGNHAQGGHDEDDAYGRFSFRTTHCNFFVSD